MLTKQDLQAIGNLIDKKVATDIAAIQGRLADFETGRVTRYDVMRLENSLAHIEKRLAGVEGRLDKMVTKDELVRKLKPIHFKLNRLNKKFDDISDDLDGHVMKLEKRTNRIEDYLGLPSSI